LITKINACTNEGARSSHNIKKKLFCVTKVFLFLGDLIPNKKNDEANFQRYCGCILVCTIGLESFAECIDILMLNGHVVVINLIISINTSTRNERTKMS